MASQPSLPCRAFASRSAALSPGSGSASCPCQFSRRRNRSRIASTPQPGSPVSSASRRHSSPWGKRVISAFTVVLPPNELPRGYRTPSRASSNFWSWRAVAGSSQWWTKKFHAMSGSSLAKDCMIGIERYGQSWSPPASSTSTRCPARARLAASGPPPAPEPTTTKSYSCPFRGDGWDMRDLLVVPLAATLPRGGGGRHRADGGARRAWGGRGGHRDAGPGAGRGPVRRHAVPRARLAGRGGQGEGGLALRGVLRQRLPRRARHRNQPGDRVPAGAAAG